MGEQLRNEGDQNKEFRAESPEKSLEMKKQTIINLLVNYRDNWENEIPKDIVHGTDKDNQYKARKGWFAGVFLTMELAITNQLISPDLNEKYQELLKKYVGEEFKSRATNQEDIEEMNQFIDETLNYLQEK